MSVLCQRLVSGLIVVAALATGIRSASACPFCSAAPTLTQRMDESVTAYVFELVASRPGNDEAGLPGSSRVQVRYIFKQNELPTKDAAGQPLPADAEQSQPLFTRGPEMRPGLLLDLPWYVSGERGQTFLQCGNLGEGLDLLWDSPLLCSATLLEYLQGRPPTSVPPVERLPYFIPFLEHADETIAVDSYSEFGMATYGEVAALRQHFDRAKLVKWLTTPAPEGAGRIARRGFYGMVLGLCGTDADAGAIEPILLTPGEDFRVGIDGMMAGYLMLRREAGLQRLEQHVFNPTTPLSDVFALHLAVSFLWDFSSDALPRERIRETVRRMLPDVRFTELALTSLTRWEDLQLVDELPKLYGEPLAGDTNLQTAIFDYYLTICALDPAGRTLEEQAALERAAHQLETLRALDPEVYQRAERRALRPASVDNESDTGLLVPGDQGFRPWIERYICHGRAAWRC